LRFGDSLSLLVELAMFRKIMVLMCVLALSGHPARCDVWAIEMPDPDENLEGASIYTEGTYDPPPNECSLKVQRRTGVNPDVWTTVVQKEIPSITGSEWNETFPFTTSGRYRIILMDDDLEEMASVDFNFTWTMM
jgi:hypothetical protein